MQVCEDAEARRKLQEEHQQKLQETKKAEAAAAKAKQAASPEAGKNGATCYDLNYHNLAATHLMPGADAVLYDTVLHNAVLL